VNHSSPVVKCRKVAHSRSPPPAWVGFLSVPSQGQAEREESASLANFGLQPCCSTHCPVVRQRLYTLAHYTGKRESTFDPNGILIWTSLFWLSTITGTLVQPQAAADGAFFEDDDDGRRHDDRGVKEPVAAVAAAAAAAAVLAGPGPPALPGAQAAAMACSKNGGRKRRRSSRAGVTIIIIMLVGTLDGRDRRIGEHAKAASPLSRGWAIFPPDVCPRAGAGLRTPARLPAKGVAGGGGEGQPL
jgi:hypothetical protein